MFAHQPISYLLASPDVTILQTVEPIVQNFGARASTVDHAQGALEIFDERFSSCIGDSRCDSAGDGDRSASGRGPGQDAAQKATRSC